MNYCPRWQRPDFKGQTRYGQLDISAEEQAEQRPGSKVRRPGLGSLGYETKRWTGQPQRLSSRLSLGSLLWLTRIYPRVLSRGRNRLELVLGRLGLVGWRWRNPRWPEASKLHSWCSQNFAPLPLVHFSTSPSSSPTPLPPTSSSSPPF